MKKISTKIASVAQVETQAPSKYVDEQGRFIVAIAQNETPLLIDFANFAPNVQAAIIHNGLTQRLNDCHSDITAKLFPDAVERAAAKMAAALRIVNDVWAKGLTKVAGDKTPIQGKRISKKEFATALATILEELTGNAAAKWSLVIAEKGFDNVLASASAKFPQVTSDELVHRILATRESVKADEDLLALLD